MLTFPPRGHEIVTVMGLPVGAGAGRECVRSAVRVLMEDYATFIACTGCERDVVNGWVCAGGDAFDEAVTNRACPFVEKVGFDVKVNADLTKI